MVKYNITKRNYADLQEDIDRLTTFSAAVGLALQGDHVDADYGNEAWRSLPQHLCVAIELKEQQIIKEQQQ